MTWISVVVAPPTPGARVIVRGDADQVHVITWTDKAAERWAWWLPRSVLP